MSKHHDGAGDYAAAMDARGVPKVCGYRHRRDWGACRGPLRRDHVIELQDVPRQDPKKAWFVYACEHHHQCKTNEVAAIRRASKGGRMADTASRPPKVKGATSATKSGGKGKQAKGGGGFRSAVLTTVGVVILVGLVASYWFNVGALLMGYVSAWLPLLVLLALCAVLAVGVRYGLRVRRWLVRRRDEERADWLLAQADGIARKMQVGPGAVSIEPRGRGAWQNGLCMRGRVRYPAHVADEDPKLCKAVEDYWRHKLGCPHLVIDWNVGQSWYTYWPPPAGTLAEMEPDAPAPAEPPTDARQRAEDKLTHVMESVTKSAKGEWVGTLVRHDAIGPLEIEISWPPEFKAASDEARVTLMETINLGLPGRWRADSWDGEKRKLHLTRRPKMERFIANPGHVGRVAWHLVPLGRDESGSVVIFDALSIPHALVVGATRRGKSVCLRTIIFAVLNAPPGTPLVDVPAVVLLDPKEVEFGAFEDVPGVVEVATEDKQMADAVDRVFWEMKRRYRWKKRHGVPLTKHRPIYLVIDEYQEFVEAVNDAHIAKKGTTGKEHPAVSKTRRIARLGAAARIYLILATQRPDLDWFKGVLRENIQFRLAFGQLSPQASDMAFGRRDIGRDIPDKIDGQLLRGRGNCSVGDDGMPREFQAYWTPNPDPDEEPNAADRALLDLLIPKQRDGLEEPMWDLDRLLAEFSDEDEDDEDDGSGASRTRSRATKTRPQARPKVRERRREAAETTHLRALRLSIKCGAPRWIMLDGECVLVEAVEPDESTEDHWLITVSDGEGHARDPISFPDSTAFDLAEE